MSDSVHYWVDQFAVTPDLAGHTRLHELARRLRGRGVMVEVVAADLNLFSRAYTRRRHSWQLGGVVRDEMGVPFHWLHTFRYRKNDGWRHLNQLRFAQAAFAHLMTVPLARQSVMIGSSPSLLAAQAAALAARARGARFVLEVRDLWPQAMIEVSGKRGAVAAGLERVAASLYRAADRVVVLTEHNAEHLVAQGVAPEKILYVPNGADLDAFSARDLPPLPGAVEAALVRLRGRMVVVYAGAHGPANDLYTVLEAARLLARGEAGEGSEQVALLLCGDGVEKRALQERAARDQLANLVFCDPLPKTAVPALLRRCDAGLHTLKDVPLFRTGVSPNKLFDYMAAELPVVTNVAGECAAMVRRAECGIAVQPGDAAALARALAQLSCAGDRPEMGARGRTFVARHHDRETLTDRLLELFPHASA